MRADELKELDPCSLLGCLVYDGGTYHGDIVMVEGIDRHLVFTTSTGATYLASQIMLGTAIDVVVPMREWESIDFGPWIFPEFHTPFSKTLDQAMVEGRPNCPFHIGQRLYAENVMGVEGVYFIGHVKAVRQCAPSQFSVDTTGSKLPTNSWELEDGSVMIGCRDFFKEEPV